MKNIFRFSLLFLVIFIGGCSSDTYEEISVSDAYSKMVTEDVIVLDVRSLEEFETGHLVDAINVPVDMVKSDFSKKVTDDKNSTIIVYCQSGKRAIEASKILTNMGYINVYTFGGINDWTYELE